MHVHLNPLAFLSTLAPCVLEVPGCLLEQFSDHPPVGAETKVRCLEDVQQIICRWRDLSRECILSSATSSTAIPRGSREGLEGLQRLDHLNLCPSLVLRCPAAPQGT